MKEVPTVKELESLAFRVRFKKVGQGDTIILEHGSIAQKTLSLGIIDCKCDKTGQNALIGYLNYLQFCGIKYEIKFIIISHPHLDHFSGIAELLEKVRQENLTLNELGHTLNFHNDYPKSEQSLNTCIGKIRSQIGELAKKRKEAFSESTINHGTHLFFTDEIDLYCFAPEGRETSRYLDISRFCYDRGRKPPSRAANLLSTLLAITYKDQFVLLTSDAEKKIFERVLNHLKKRLNGYRLYGAQIPHHGSERNYHKGFWEAISDGTGQQIAIISAKFGDPKHPAKSVTDHLKSAKYVIKETHENSKIERDSKYSAAMMTEISDVVDLGEEDTLLELPLRI